MSGYDSTLNYNLKKPWVDADFDAWGDHWNQNADAIDNLFQTMSNKAIVGPSPDSPGRGALWWDSVGGQLYVQYDDGNSVQFVSANSVLGLPITGGQLSGPLLLYGNATQPLEAVPLQQLNAATAGGPFLPLAGNSTVTGNSTFNGHWTTAAHLTGTATDSNATINATAVGSGVNGPATAQIGLSINAIKDGWSVGTAAVGEIDGLSIMCRQGGAGSDCSGLLVNCQNTGAGYISGIDMSTSVLNLATGRYSYFLGVNVAGVDPASNEADGIVCTAQVGALATAFVAQSSAQSTYSASWANFFRGMQNGVQMISIDGSGSINTSGSILINNGASGVLTVQGSNAAATVSGANLMWNLGTTGGLSGATYLLNNHGGGTGGFLFGEVTNAGVVTSRLTIDGSGLATFAGSVSAPSIHVPGEVYLRADNAVGVLWDASAGGIQFNISGNAAEVLGSGGLSIFGTKVIGTQIAGWGTSTGGVRGAITGSSTLPQVAAALAQLLTDLKTHGLLGA